MAVFILQQQRQHNCRKILTDYLWLMWRFMYFLLFWKERYLSFPQYQVFGMSKDRSDCSVLGWGEMYQRTLFLEKQGRRGCTWGVHKEAADVLHTFDDYLSGFALFSSVENGRPLDPADWAVTDVVNYFRTAGFEEQANAFQEQVNLLANTFCLPPVSHIAHFCREPGYKL